LQGFPCGILLIAIGLLPILWRIWKNHRRPNEPPASTDSLVDWAKGHRLSPARTNFSSPRFRKVAVLVNIDKRKQKMTVSLDGVETYEWPIGWAEGIEGFLVVGTSVQLPFDRRALRH
jgi:hypothetical protein